MIVRVENDICVVVVSPGPFRGKYIYHPSSVRRDLPMQFSMPARPLVQDRPWKTKDAERAALFLGED